MHVHARDIDRESSTKSIAKSWKIKVYVRFENIEKCEEINLYPLLIKI